MYVHQLPVVEKMDICSKLFKKFTAEGMSKDEVRHAVTNALDSKHDDIKHLLEDVDLWQ